ncbi:hypothetical protein CcaverHIS631_0200780 [Cutaneotrichosporon cavernicola]|nr:hypothetical protein CcaverHIS631_0200780 [Cutaneotrichosporon cavernicola]
MKGGDSQTASDKDKDKLRLEQRDTDAALDALPRLSPVLGLGFVTRATTARVRRAITVNPVDSIATANTANARPTSITKDKPTKAGEEVPVAFGSSSPVAPLVTAALPITALASSTGPSSVSSSAAATTSSDVTDLPSAAPAIAPHPNPVPTQAAGASPTVPNSPDSPLLVNVIVYQVDPEAPETPSPQSGKSPKNPNPKTPKRE